MEGWRSGGVGRDERAELRTRAFLWLAEQHSEAEREGKRSSETISDFVKASFLHTVY